MDVSALLRDTLVTGLPFVPGVLGMYLVFRIREDFDLTVDGSFTLGGAVSAALLLNGAGLAFAMIAAVACGAAAGLATAAIHVSLKVPVLLAGLITSIGLYTVNLRVMGQPTLGLLEAPTLFSGGGALGERLGDGPTIAILAAFALVAAALMAYFLKTEIGLALRVSGVNLGLARSLGVSATTVVVISLALANALVALSGSLVAQNQSFADVGMGTGTLLAGIGAFLLGELLLRPQGSAVIRAMAAVVLGTLVYRLILTIALDAGLAPTDLQAAIALTLIAALLARRFGDGFSLRRVLGTPWRASARGEA